VAEILITARRELVPFAPSAHSDPEVRQWVREVLLPTHEVTVATEGGQVVGVLACSRKGENSWIDQLMLHPTVVGRGIGSQLLGHAIATMPLPIRLYTFQPHVRARKFYERHGFVAIEFTDGKSNEEGVPDVLYELAT
jgi:GNAT superfamily N-acetyltransferase